MNETWMYDEITNMPAEQAVLSALLFGGVEDVASFGADDFYWLIHKEIFLAVKQLTAEGKKCDLPGLFGILHADAREYLAGLEALFLGASGYEAHKRAVKDSAYRRQLLALSESMRKASFDFELSAEVLGAQFSASFESLMEKAVSESSTVRELLPDYYESVEKKTGKKGLPGLATGFKDFDAATGGLCDGCLYVLAARPGMGKSAFASMVALRAAKETDVLFFSLEMSKELILQRIVAQHCNIPNAHLKLGTLSFPEWDTFATELTSMSALPIHIDDRAGLSAQEALFSALKLNANLSSSGRRIGLVVVDYLQIMGGKDKDRRQVVEENSRQLKVMAKRLSCPVLMLSQLSRASEQSSDKRPMLSHLRETGAIEQDADLVAFIHRPYYYDRDYEDEREAEVIIAKQRDGALITVRVDFDADTTAFRDKEEALRLVDKGKSWEQIVNE